MKSASTFGLPSTVADPILSLAADIIGQAASLGPGRWGLTPRKIGFRVNVGWTEIFTICEDHLRLIVVDDLVTYAKMPKGVPMLVREDGGPYYPSVPGSVCLQLPYSLKGKIVVAIKALRPGLKEAVSLAGKRRSGISIKKGHKQAVVEQLAAAIGRKLPSPQYENSDDTPDPDEKTRAEYQSSDEVRPDVSYKEGATTQIIVNAYERNAEAREACITHYGATCAVCGFDFGQVYGELGEGFTHVHHLRDLATIGEEYQVDPLKDLRPVCANCHAMLHREVPAMSIKKLKGLMRT
jgi:5-methylcytosine-specific restriction protein A